MTQLDLPLQATFIVRVQSTVDVKVFADSAKQARDIVKQQMLPQVPKGKIQAIWREDLYPKDENESSDETSPRRPPPGRPNGGGTQGGGTAKLPPKPADAIAKSA